MPNSNFDPDRWRLQRTALRYAVDLLDDAAVTAYRDTCETHISEAFIRLRTAFGDLGPHNIWTLYLRLRGLELTEHQRRLIICSDCRELYPRHFTIYCSDSDEHYCPTCTTYCADYFWPTRTGQRWEEEEEDDDSSDLLDYSASPLNYFGKHYLAVPGETVTPTTRLFGLEIEFVADTYEGLSKMISQQWEDKVGIYKNDGSLPHRGAEFCTLPMTRKAVTTYLAPVLQYMVSHGAKAWNRPSCGLHVHVARASASWLTWGKVDRFFANARNQDFLTQVAGRSPNDYCYRDPTTRPRTVPVKGAYSKCHGRPEQRYKALNFNSSAPTVEFRMFRGNVAYLGVLRAVQFCDSIIEFAKSQSNESEMNYSDYIDWLQRQSKAYSQLMRFVRGKPIENAAA